MSKCNSVCVYCGSSNVVDDAYKTAAKEFGSALGAAGKTLVYGGGRVGLMGISADSTLQAGGKVIGIIPHHIANREIEHKGLTELHVVESMHIRKRMMVDHADAFVVLPGGIGTLDELCEILTWRQLGMHDKPIVICNVGGYWTPFLNMLDHTINSGFMQPEHRGLYRVVEKAEDILPAIEVMPTEHFDPATKWI